MNKDSDKTASENGTGDKTLFKIPFKLSKKSRDKEQNAKETGDADNAGEWIYLSIMGVRK